MEEWKVIPNTAYELSTLGNIRYHGLYEIPKRKNSAGQWAVKLNIDGKPIVKAVHQLMADIFLPDWRLPYLVRGNVHEKRGRPSRKQVKYRAENYEVKLSKYVVFKDGNSDNLSLDNIKFLRLAKGSAYKPKYKNVFYTGQALIELINKNTTKSNSEDNRLIIEYLNGNSNSIGKLFMKYQNAHKVGISIFLKKKAKGYEGKKRKENAMQIDDFIIESQMKIMTKIKNGRFDGKNFKAWSIKLMEKYIEQFFVKQSKKDLIDKTQTFIG